jgi:hypothetical protein
MAKTTNAEVAKVKR